MTRTYKLVIGGEGVATINIDAKVNGLTIKGIVDLANVSVHNVKELKTADGVVYRIEEWETTKAPVAEADEPVTFFGRPDTPVDNG